ncbi:MAG: ABC-F family ATP-binding cassette domain-containing protein, partial [Rhodospirillales bacterium]|nr:ABC-F family ATP-binding cassette domain-containing protein [Rhodospirillales bacterium]
RIAEIHERLIQIEADSAPARAHAILAGLGFDDEERLQPCASFSGGWRMRVALAAALFSKPDLLLLDEPSNHLDLEAITWLEGHLAKWSGSLMLISHERDLLNNVVDEIFHLERGSLNRYVGDYDNFEKTRAERRDLEARMAKRQAAERKRIEAFVERFRYKATKARQAQSRVKMLARMSPIQGVMEEDRIDFQFPETAPLAPPIIALSGAAAGYDTGKPVIANLDLRIDMDDRIALLGANGNGKSTLIKMLAGRLKLMAGKIVKARKLKIGYFAQHQADELDAEGSPFDHMMRLAEDKVEHRQRAHLGRFGFAQERANTLVRDLSGGEKARLLFALMSLDQPHILLLDEPSNHLDMDARTSLVQALNAYQGA